MKTYSLFACIILLCALGCSSQVVDASSKEALEVSVQAISKDLDPEETYQLIQDIDVIFMSNVLFESPGKDADEGEPEFYVGIDGKTLEEIRELADQRRIEFDARDAKVAEVLSNIDQGLEIGRNLKLNERLEKEFLVSSLKSDRRKSQALISKYLSDVAEVTSPEEKVDLQTQFSTEFRILKAGMYDQAMELDALIKRNAKGIIID